MSGPGAAARAAIAAAAVAAGLGAAACAHPRAGEIRAARPGRAVAIYVPRPDDPDALATGRGAAVGEVAAPAAADVAAAAPTDQALAYVDDRRWVDVPAGGELVLPDLPATADLDSLVVEPLGEPATGPGAVEIAQCTRTGSLAVALADPAAARGLVGRTVVAHLVGGGDARGVVASADEGGLWLDDGPRSVRVALDRIAGLRIAGDAAGAVRCRVQGPAGRHLLRIAYAAAGVSWRAVHRLDVALGGDGAGTATVRSGFEIDAAGFTGEAELALWRGVPGAGEAPERVWTGAASLGDAVTVWSAPRQAPAHLVDIYRGAAAGGELPTDPYWHQQSRSAVEAWLIVDAPLPEGVAMAAVTTGDGPPRIARGALERRGAAARMVLWADGELHGLRVMSAVPGEDRVMRDNLKFSVADVVGRAREVWIEEQLRPARRRRLVHAPPGVEVEDGWLRAKVSVPAGGAAHLAVDIVYDL